MDKRIYESVTINGIGEIEQHFGIIFPKKYKELILENEEIYSNEIKEYCIKDYNDYTAWGINFIRMNNTFINKDRIGELVPDPKKIIPFAWSVSSGDWLVFDYRKNENEPSIMYIYHEEAIGIEDAKDECVLQNKTVEQMLEENLFPLCDSFEEFYTVLEEYN